MNKYAVLFLLIVSLCSCTKSEWWVGTWHIDKIHSEAKNKSLGESMLGGMAETMVYGIFDKADFVITKDEVMIIRNGSGTSKPCKVISRPSDTSVVLQTGDTIDTYNLEDGFLVIAPSGTPTGMKFYFKRAEQGAAANP